MPPNQTLAPPRCERHAGEVFVPRCFECDQAAREHAEDLTIERAERAAARRAALATNHEPRARRRRTT